VRLVELWRVLLNEFLLPVIHPVLEARQQPYRIEMLILLV